MDKRVILAVAGSGKTSYIIDQIDGEARVLIITYTRNNIENLKDKIIKKIGYIPKGVYIYSYFTFLYSFCFRPLLGNSIETKGIYWDQPPPWTLKKSRSSMEFYLNRSGYIYHNRIAKFLEEKGVLEEVKGRIRKYFSHIYIDEIQDFGGHDFNLLPAIADSTDNILFVGDFFQHTYDTSRDGRVNEGLYDDLEKYKEKFQAMGLRIDSETLSKSYRCTHNVCDFITGELGIEIKSCNTNSSKVHCVKDKKWADRIIRNDKIIKLFLNSHYKYTCYSDNWGASKGQDCHLDVCVVLNDKTFKAFERGDLRSLPTQTINKLYVACTRPRRVLYLIPEKIIK